MTISNVDPHRNLVKIPVQPLKHDELLRITSFCWDDGHSRTEKKRWPLATVTKVKKLCETKISPWEICKTYESPMVVRSHQKKRSQQQTSKNGFAAPFYLTQHTQQIEAVERTRQTLKSSKHQIPNCWRTPRNPPSRWSTFDGCKTDFGWCPSMRLMLAARQQWCLFLVFFPWNDSEIRRKMVRKNHQVEGGNLPLM